MNANQIPYDQLDWLQIAIYFLALPVVAFLGASIGLVWRWRRGGMLWSTNVGLLGGAVACVILALGLSSLERESITNYLGYFLVEYRWKMLAATLSATVTCAAIAGFSWRWLHAPGEIRPLAFSMRSMLLVQLFALISMGSFVGLRFVMLENCNDPRLVDVFWNSPGWILSKNGYEVTFDSSPLSPAEREAALSADRIKQIANNRNLHWLSLRYDTSWNTDLTPLLQAPSITTINVDLLSASSEFIDQFAASRIQHRGLTGDFRRVDLAPLSSSKQLESLRLSGSASKTTIESLSIGSEVKRLSLEKLVLTLEERPISRWPTDLQRLTIYGTTIGQRDLDSLASHANLLQLHAPDFVLDEASFNALKSIPTLEWVSIGIDSRSEKILPQLAQWSTPKLTLFVHHPQVDRALMKRIVQIPRLEALELSKSIVTRDAIDLLAGKESLDYLALASANLTKSDLLKLAVLPKLRTLRYPFVFSLPARAVETAFGAKRDTLQLQRVHLISTTPVGPIPSREEAVAGGAEIEVEIP